MIFTKGPSSIELTSREESTPIFNTAGTSPAGEALATGSMPGEGTYFCLACGTQISLRETDSLPQCARCSASRFRRDSIFSSLQEHGSKTVEFAVTGEREPPGWLDEARERLAAPGYQLAMREQGEISTYPLGEGWTRIGRCSTADICLDDPSVSRRHALIVSELPDTLRVLDDRSLNSVFLNGEAVEWARLGDGDELAIGRFRLFALES